MDDPHKNYEEARSEIRRWQTEDRARYDERQAEILDALRATDVQAVGELTEERYRWDQGACRWVDTEDGKRAENRHWTWGAS